MSKKSGEGKTSISAVEDKSGSAGRILWKVFRICLTVTTTIIIFVVAKFGINLISSVSGLATICDSKSVSETLFGGSVKYACDEIFPPTHKHKDGDVGGADKPSDSNPPHPTTTGSRQTTQEKSSISRSGVYVSFLTNSGDWAVLIEKLRDLLESKSMLAIDTNSALINVKVLALSISQKNSSQGVLAGNDVVATLYFEAFLGDDKTPFINGKDGMISGNGRVQNNTTKFAQDDAIYDAAYKIYEKIRDVMPR